MLANEKLREHWRFILPALALLLGLALSAGGAFAGAPTSSPALLPATQANVQQVKEQPFDCSKIKELGIEKQTNIHAMQIMAACAGFPQPPIDSNSNNSTNSNLNLNTLNNLAKNYPAAYGGTDVNVILPEGTNPHLTQSETMVWAHGNTIVANYNDSKVASACYAGYSYSTDSGATWTRPGGSGASPLCTGHGTNYGDPIVVYNNALSLWFIGDLATGCGGQGIGMWTSADGMTYTAGACAHNGTQDDRESMWVDNTPSSPHYGRMYISFNDFAVGGGALRVVYSDNGTTWSTSVPVTAAFIRDVQITGGPDGTVFIASMDEGGGGLNTRQNIMQRSTDGGATWTAIIMGARFPAPGVATSGYFAMMFPTIWRFMGWGQPAAGPGGVVHYAYTQHGTGSDAADMMYVRSTDNGATWGTPIQLNTDTSGRPNWQGSLAATANGTVFAGWYDGREATSCGSPGANTPCYRRYGRMSQDNGATWQADDMVGDAMSPLPAQPDSAVQTVYEGDYDYSSTEGVTIYTTWMDGRTLVGGVSQQDVWFDKIVGGPTFTPTRTATPCNPACTNTPTITRTFTATPTPTICGIYAAGPAVAATIVPGTTDIGNHTDDGVTTINLPFPVQFYNDMSFTSVNVSSNGNLQFETQSVQYINECLPSTSITGPAIMPFWEDQRTDTGTCSPGPCGIYTSISGTAPNRIFNIEWRTFYYTGAGTLNYEVRLYESAPAPDFDIILGNITGTLDSVTIGVQDRTGQRITEVVCDTSAAQYVNKLIPMIFNGCGPTRTPTRTPTPCPNCTGTATRTASPTATCSSGYGYVVSSGTVVPATTDTGNHTDDGVTSISLPFPFTFYGTAYSSASVASNGNLQFTTTSVQYINECLPSTSITGPAIMPFWEDFRTDDLGTCDPGPCGIYTSVTGNAPNRIFNIEWRTYYYTGTGNANFEIRLYEGLPSRVDVIVGNITGLNSSETIGVQDGLGGFTQYMCNTAVTNNTRIAFAQGGCGSPVPTSTPTRTNTPGQSTSTPTRPRTNTPQPGTSTPTRIRTNTPQPTPCGTCAIEMLAVVTSCSLDGTVHWIAIAHNPDRCGVSAPWRAELQVRQSGGNFRTVRIQYATHYFGSGDTIMDGYFCYHFPGNTLDVRVEYLFEDQANVSKGSKAQVQERAAPPNSYSTTPDSGIPTSKDGSNSPATCDGDMASQPMAPCSQTSTCGGPPTPLPTGVATRAPILPKK